MSTQPRCTEHLSCRIPAHISPDAVRTEPVDNSDRAFWVIWRGDRLGSIQEEMPGRWTVFSGGNAVATQVSPATSEAAIKALLAHVTNSAFHWRMSLHG